MSQEHKDVTSVWQVVKFTLFSISAGLIQVAAFTLMETVFHLPYWPSYLTALVLSVLWFLLRNVLVPFLPPVLDSTPLIYGVGTVVFAVYDYGFTKLIGFYMARVQRNLKW